MWVKVDDSFSEHPKVVEAGRHLGPYGRGRVVAVWLVAMCYCNRNYTDGFVDELTVRTWTLFDRRPLDVAFVMAEAGLMSRVDGGFRFHDYLDYQPAAAEIKAKRKKDRDRKREERRRPTDVRADVPTDVPTDVLTLSARNPARSRARDPVPGLSSTHQNSGAHAPDWFEECKQLHYGDCGSSRRHRTRMLVDAEKARAS